MKWCGKKCHLKHFVLVTRFCGNGSRKIHCRSSNEFCMATFHQDKQRHENSIIALTANCSKVL